MQYKALLTASAALLVAGTTAAADTFTDPAAYDAAVGAQVQPDYDNLAAVSFPADTTTDFYGFFDVTPNGGTAAFNTASNFTMTFAAGGLTSTVITLPTPSTGISGIWSNTFVQDGFAVTINGTTYDLAAINGDTLGADFVGITDATPFTEVTLTTAPPGGGDFVFFTDFYYAPAVVPEPASLGLLGLAGLGLLRRRR